MKKSNLFFACALMLCSHLLNAQDIFKQHGFTKEPLTLCNGSYNEFFNNDEVIQIGTVLLNTKTMKIVAFVNEETDTTYKAELSSRWLSPDPLAAKYPQVSPYVYCVNNPIIFIDPDGRKIVYASNLSAEQRQMYESRINDLCSSNKYFNTIYSRLKSSDQTYTLYYGTAKSGLGEFRPNRNGGGAIDFKSSDYFNDNSSFIEEFFHGYQADFYGVSSMIDIDNNGDIPGASNKEVEARFFKMATGFEDFNFNVGEMPGQEGLSDLLFNSLMSFDSQDNMKIDFTKLSPEQKEKYLKIVKNFASYWKNFNQQTGKNNVYDDTPTDEGPDAALDVFDNANK